MKILKRRFWLFLLKLIGLTNLLLFFTLKFINIKKTKHAQIRVYIFNFLISQLQSIMIKFDFNQKLLISKEEVYVEDEGISLSTEKTNRYYKVNSKIIPNQGSLIFKNLSTLGINNFKNIIDLGANFGEVSIWFSKNFPDANIFAIEASSDNFRILKKNILIQNFNTSNITAQNIAVADRVGSIEITSNFGAQNSIVLDNNNPRIRKGGKLKTETVSCNTLEGIFSSFNIKFCDLIKIDIEGAEPLLKNSLEKLLDRIGSIHIEIGDKSSFEKYMDLISPLLKAGFVAIPEERFHERYFKIEDFNKSIGNYYITRFQRIKHLTNNHIYFT